MFYKIIFRNFKNKLLSSISELTSDLFIGNE